MGTLSLQQKNKFIGDLVEALMFKNSGFAHLLRWIPRKAVDVNEIAYTDGKSIHMGNKFFTELKAQQQAFCVMHEVLHIAMRHPTRAQGLVQLKDAALWNITTDLVINYALGAENERVNIDYAEMDIPEGIVTFSSMEEKFGFHIPKQEETNNGYRSWSSENLFRFLKNKINQSENKQEIEEYLESLAKQSGIREGKSSSGGKGTGDNQSEEGQGGISEKDFLGDLYEGDLGDETSEKCPDAKDIENNVWIKRFQQACGDDTLGVLAELTGDLPYPKVDWRAKLKHILATQLKPDPKKDNTRQNRSFQARRSNVYVPGRTRERGVRKIAILHDASGSCWDEETFKEFLKEIEAIQTSTKAELEYMTFDADVESVNTLEYDPARRLVDRVSAGDVELRGGGGTSFHPPIRWLNENASDADIAIMFTDTFAPTDDLPTPKTKFLWAVVQNDEFEPPFGDSLFIQKEDSN